MEEFGCSLTSGMLGLKNWIIFMDVTCVSSVMAVQKLKFSISFRFHWKPGNPSFHEILRIALRKLIFWEKEQDGKTWNECETAVQKTLRSRQNCY